VKIVDFDGNVLAGKTAIAFTWNEPYFGKSEGVPQMPSARKFFLMNNTISNISDENGIA
jgi:hypothetical protein